MTSKYDKVTKMLKDQLLNDKDTKVDKNGNIVKELVLNK